MTYEQRHAAMGDARRDAIAATRAWLTDALPPYAVWQMAADMDVRLPLGDADPVRIADAVARRSLD